MSLVRLGDVCEVTTGQAAPQIPDAFSSSGVPFVRAGSLQALCAGSSESSLELIQPANAKRFRLRLFPEDTVVFAKSGMSANLGRVHRLSQDCYLVSHLAAVLPSPAVDPGYLHRWFECNPASRLITNEAYPSIKTSTIQDIRVPLPPLPEQRRIAAILDKADALRAKRRLAIAKLDQLLQSVFLEMFGDPVVNPKGWPEVALDELVASTKLGVIRSASEFGFDPKFGVPYVRMDAISREGQFLPDRVQRTKAAPAELQENSLQYGDLLFNTRNSRELVGKSAIFNQQGEWIFNNNLMRIRFRPQASHHYIHSYLYSNRGHRELEARKSGTTSVFAVYHKDLKTLPIPLPPRSLQEKFAEICKSVDQSKGRLETEATQMNALMASLQHSFFPAAA